MGLVHSLFRILGRRNEEDEDCQRPIYPYRALHHRGEDSERLPKISIFREFYGILFQKVQSIFGRRRGSPTKTPDPIIPIQNPDNGLISSTEEQLLHPDNLAVCVEEIIAQRKDDRAVEEGRKEVQKMIEENINVDEENWVQNPDNIGPSLRQNILIFNSDDHGFHPDNFIVCVDEIAQRINNIVVEEGGKEAEKVMIKSIYVDQGKWINHYCSRHRILLVGEGDFSFSASLAIAFGCASNMIATSLDSEDFLKANYGNARANIMELRKRSCQVMHEIDATKMANHALLRHLKFDRIVFNFPFAGFFKHLSRDAQLRLHRNLVSRFLENAEEMMSENGEIHITHKANGFHIEWDLESLASGHGLYLVEAIKFNHRDYPGYSTKCGFGGDDYFNCNPSKTYKFGHKRGVYY